MPIDRTRPCLIVIGGPTASGKTALAIKIAQEFEAEIISADSRQVYKEMSIGTACPTAEEQNAVPHHFVQHRSIHQAYSAGDYEREVTSFLKNYFQKKKVAVLVGGTGLYLRAVCEGLDSFPQTLESAVQEVNELHEAKGIEGLQQLLEKLDEVYYQTVDLQNPARLRRALEVCLSSGLPYSSFKSGAKAQRDFRVIKLGLELPRATLYERIDQRVTTMMETGLLEEAKELWPFRQLHTLATVGYTELFEHFEGKFDLANATNMIQQHSRNYAKRQITWLKREEGLQWVNPLEPENIIEYLRQNI